MEKQLNEVFISPLGLKPVIQFDNEILYSSDNVNQQFLKALYKSGRTRTSIIGLKSLIDKGSIVPCYLQKGMLNFISWRIFKSKPVVVDYYDSEDNTHKQTTINPIKAAHSVMGFYSLHNGKVVIIMSNLANIFSYVSNNFLSQLTVHELVHKLAIEKKEKFLSLYNDRLINFYKTLWTRLFNLTNKNIDNEVLNIIKILSKIERTKTPLTTSHLRLYFNQLSEFEKYTSLDKEKFQNLLLDYMRITAFFIKDLSLFFSKMKKFGHILSPIYDTYKSEFGVTNTDTICIQELVFPSEIIAIYSEHAPPNEIKRFIDILD